MEPINTLFQLWLSFARIGFTSFGGSSMIPLILDEMESHGWMTADDLTNLIAIAEMTPGSLGVNAATFAGNKTAGFIGGIAAVLGVLCPSLTLTLTAAVFFTKFRTSKVMHYIMYVVKPICVGMIIAVLLSLSLETYVNDAGTAPDLLALGICVLSFYLLRRHKMSVPKVLSIAACLGLVAFGVL